jgi:hypothetical protein
MTELTFDMNWAGVLAGAVLAFFIGWIWYSSFLFGPRWAAATGVEHTSKPEVFPLVLQGLGLFLMSWFVGIMAREGLLLATILVTLATVVICYAGDTFAKLDSDVKLIHGGHWLTVVVVMIGMQALL